MNTTSFHRRALHTIPRHGLIIAVLLSFFALIVAPAQSASRSLEPNLTGGPDTYGYTFADSSEASCTTTFTDISGTGTALGLGDDGEGNITIPFSFDFYGNSSTNLRVGNNGAVLFNTTSGDVDWTNGNLSGAAAGFYPFWDDIDNDTGNVYWQTLGSSPNRRAIVQWEDRPHFNNIGNSTFQVVLNESDGAIDFVYQDVDFGNATYDNGASATIGISDGGSDSLTYSQNTASLSGVSAICFTGPSSGADITGTVFRDYDGDGANDSGEPGIGTVIVTAVDAAGNTASTTTAADGTYTILNTDGSPSNLSGEVRIEFTLPNDGSLDFLQPGAAGGTTVQFANITTGATVDAGFNNPAQYTQLNPDVITSQFAFGDRTASPYDSVISIAYTAPNQGFNNPAANTAESTMAQTGSVYGLAYHRQSEHIFTAAFLKRHADLGPNGIGAIYIIDRNNGSPNATLYADLSNGSLLNPGTGSNLAIGAAGTFSRTAPVDWITDGSSFGWVGKTGLGDIELSDDEQTLYVVNMHDRQLYQLPVDLNNPTAPAALAAAPVPIPTGDCTNPADARPMGLGFYDGYLYAGVTCSAESTVSAGSRGTHSELAAYVYRFDPAVNTFNTTPVMTVDLTYQRGCIFTNFSPRSCAVTTDNAAWQPWQPDWQVVFNDVPPGNMGSSNEYIEYSQPLLSDIAFDNGDMLIGLRDINGDRTGQLTNDPAGGANTPNNHKGNGMGDILRACGSPGSGWTLESNGTCGSVTASSGGPGNGQGPGGGEFYHQDQGPGGPSGSGGNGHDNTVQGAILQLPGYPDAVVSAIDSNGFYDGGFLWLNNSNGETSKRVEVYRQTAPDLFGKANGLGDVEALIDAAPLEIGNRVWCDADSNGLQDPGEANVGAGIQVVLTCGGESATATTDAIGEYLFTDALWAAAGGTSSSQIPRESSCSLSISYTGSNGTALASACSYGSVHPTALNADGEELNEFNSDLRDSDGIDDGSTQASVGFETGGPGDNNHTFDFGFSGTPIPDTDWGDLPDTFDTTASSGPSHTINGNLYLGSCVDSEGSGAPDEYAGIDGIGGDDYVPSTAAGTCIDNDDEDGVVLADPLIPGAESCVSVAAVNSTAGNATLQGWIDFNGNGTFDVGEELDTGDFAGGGATVANGGPFNQELCFTVPGSASFDGGETHMRFRLSSAGSLASNGAAADGEVEDYFEPLMCVGNHVWADGDANGQQNEAGSAGINGVTVELVWSGEDADFQQTADNKTYTSVTAADGGVDGKYQFCGLIPGDYRVDIPTAPASFGFATGPNAGGDDQQDSDGSQVGGYGGLVQGPVFSITPASYSGGSLFSLPTGEAGTGDTPGALDNFPDSSDDLTFDFGFVNSASQDWGDLPDSFGTSASNSGAVHTVTGPYLGDCVDRETSGYPTSTADGEDVAASAPSGTTGTCTTSNDDEDGVSATGNWSDGTGDLTVVASADACLNVWLDFTDGATAGSDGDFGDTLSAIDEWVVENQAVTAGSNAISFSLPNGVANSASFYLRARLTDRDSGGNCTNVAELYAGGAASSTGLANSGEIEDYQFAFNPTSVNLSMAAASATNVGYLWVLFAATLFLTTISILGFKRWAKSEVITQEK
ncbi:MAG: SdrD B-like domain-containing protein [Ardenticatenaceae bacterium]|nr:SdrD B-like domain-containing protein [Ardenticatenaceae bacterium]